MKRHKKDYKTPNIKIKKIKLSLFLTNKSFFHNDTDGQLETLLLAFNSSIVCFLKGTSVSMANGNTKRIEEIKEGDKVVGYNTDNNSLKEDEVLQLTSHPRTGGYLIINKTLKVTPNHMFWLNKSSWEEANKIKIGDILIDSSGKDLTVETVDQVEDSGDTYFVYNLHLKGDNHNYFAEDMLVHNAGSTTFSM